MLYTNNIELLNQNIDILLRYKKLYKIQYHRYYKRLYTKKRNAYLYLRRLNEYKLYKNVYDKSTLFKECIESINYGILEYDLIEDQIYDLKNFLLLKKLKLNSLYTQEYNINNYDENISKLYVIENKFGQCFNLFFMKKNLYNHFKDYYFSYKKNICKIIEYNIVFNKSIDFKKLHCLEYLNLKKVGD